MEESVINERETRTIETLKNVGLPIATHESKVAMNASDPPTDAPGYPATSQAIAVMRTAIEITGLKQDALAPSLIQFMREGTKRYGWKAVTFRQQDISRCTSETGKSGLLRNKRNALWTFLHHKYPSEISGAKFRLSYYDSSGAIIVDETHKSVSRGAPINPALVRRLRGRYILVRPFFYKEEELMICDLRCGLDEGDYCFSLTMEFNDAGLPERDEVKGHIIPFGDCALFQGAFTTRTGPFVFVVSELGEHVTSVPDGVGALLAGAVSKRPSAYWVVIMRTTDEVNPRVVSRKTISKTGRLWSLTEPQINRGVVRWQ